MSSKQKTRTKGPKMPFLSLVTLTFDIWPWY